MESATPSHGWEEGNLANENQDGRASSGRKGIDLEVSEDDEVVVGSLRFDVDCPDYGDDEFADGTSSTEQGGWNIPPADTEVPENPPSPDENDTATNDKANGDSADKVPIDHAPGGPPSYDQNKEFTTDNVNWGGMYTDDRNYI